MFPKLILLSSNSRMPPDPPRARCPGSRSAHCRARRHGTKCADQQGPVSQGSGFTLVQLGALGALALSLSLSRGA